MTTSDRIAGVSLVIALGVFLFMVFDSRLDIVEQRSLPRNEDPASREVPEPPPIETPPAGVMLPPAGFGEWTDGFRTDTAYPATSDGFVAAFTGGNSPADEFVIRVGRHPSRLRPLTRAQRYDGTVAPVPKDYFWLVETFGPGNVTIFWLPVGDGPSDGESSPTTP